MQFWYLDLSKTDSIMQECYSVFGPEQRPPSCMLRSYLLALKLKVTSITVWCRMLKETPLYAILSGFSFGDTPGVGTSQSMTMAFLFVSWAYVCIKMDTRQPSTGQSTGARNQTGNVAVSVNTPVHRRNMEGPYTSLPMIIQGYLTYRQGTLKHGKRNMTEGLLWNAPTP